MFSIKLEDIIKKENLSRKAEDISLLFIGITIILGIVGEILIHAGIVILPIENIDTISMNMLQIQAGVSAITVALIALITGLISVEYYGISITKFYLLLKPQVLKLFIIIGSSVSFVFVGIIFYLFSRYNLAIACFFCEWWIILASLFLISGIFQGSYMIKKEIKEFLISSFKNGMQVGLCKDYVDRLIDQWKKGCLESDFQDYIDIINTALDCFLKNNTDDSLSFVTNNWTELIGFLLSSRDEKTAITGIITLRETYDRIWAFILQDKEVGKKTSEKLEIFQNVDLNLKEAISHISISQIIEEYRFDQLFDLAARVTAYYLRNDPKQLERSLKIIEFHAALIVYQIDEKSGHDQYNAEAKANIFMGQVLRSPHITSFNIPEEVSYIYQLHRCRLYINYTVALIERGYSDILMEYLYCRQNIFASKDKPYFFLYIITVQCYMFYALDVESMRLVPNLTRECIEKLLESKSARLWFIDFILHNAKCLESDLFRDTSLEERLIDLMRPHEYYKSGEVKILLTAESVKIWHSFFILFLEKRYLLKRNLLEYFMGNPASYLSNLLTQSSEKMIVGLYTKLCRYFSGNEDYEREKKEAQQYLVHLKREMVIRLKEQEISDAFEANKKYVENNTKTQLEKEIRQKLKQKIDKEVAVIYLADGDNIRELVFEEIKIPIGNIISHTDDLDINCVCQEFDFMIGKFYDGVSETLWKNNQLKEFYCRRMPDADSYMEMIKENRIDAFMGNQYALYPSGTEKRQYFIDYLNHHISLLSTGSHMAIGFCLDALKIKINDILVTIKEPDQSLFSTQIINERGDIEIDLGNGAMGVFSQQDAKEYLRNKYKLLLISISVSLYSKDGIIGYIARTDLKREEKV